MGDTVPVVSLSFDGILAVACDVEMIYNHHMADREDIKN